MSEQRLDKWLWCARLTKTRSGAARAIAEGKVRINGERALKPSRLLHEGDVVTAKAGSSWCGCSPRRSGAVRHAGLAALYEDLTPPAAPSPERPLAAKGPRPTKRDRRRLDALRAENTKA